MKNILEFIPLLLFFIIYHKYDLITATVTLVIATILAVSIIAAQTKKIAKMPLFSALILSIFGFLTWYFNDAIFIKIKPTIINLCFAAILFSGYFMKKPILKYLFNHTIDLSDRAWLVLTLRWGIFFIFLAILNEFIWRNFTEDFWVSFKVFGFLPITIIFTISQAPYMLRHQIKE